MSQGGTRGQKLVLYENCVCELAHQQAVYVPLLSDQYV